MKFNKNYKKYFYSGWSKRRRNIIPLINIIKKKERKNYEL